MKEWIINGNKEISGTIKVNGAKNALLAILPASIITKSVINLENVTPLQDTYVMIEILKKLNVRVIYDHKDKMIIDARNVKNVRLDDENIKKIRASYYFMGALLALFKEVEVAVPGGCKFATRPIDLHLFALDKLGNEHQYQNEIYKFKKNKIKSRVIEFSKVSVGATINAILASCKIKGSVHLVNVAKEPEIDNLIAFLNSCGAKITRKGNEIIIKGVSKFHDSKFRIMEDRIEAGTYLILGACLSNNLKIIYHESEHLKAIIDLLKELNVDIKVNHDYLLVSKKDYLLDRKIIFDSYPKLPTDLQQPLSILLSKCNCTCILKDQIYPSRYTQVEDLLKMGFKMEIKRDYLLVSRSEIIEGNVVSCKDLRGGISLVIAALIANGKTRILNVEHIERGYYDIVNKLKKIGAMIYEKD